MTAKEIVVGGRYKAKISGKLTTVEVQAIRVVHGLKGRKSTIYDVRNLRTDRATVFRSASKFRAIAHEFINRALADPARQ